MASSSQLDVDDDFSLGGADVGTAAASSGRAGLGAFSDATGAEPLPSVALAAEPPVRAASFLLIRLQHVEQHFVISGAIWFGKQKHNNESTMFARKEIGTILGIQFREPSVCQLESRSTCSATDATASPSASTSDKSAEGTARSGVERLDSGTRCTLEPRARRPTPADRTAKPGVSAAACSGRGARAPPCTRRTGEVRQFRPRLTSSGCSPLRRRHRRPRHCLSLLFGSL